MVFQRVCIIGVGLLGGSIGLALHRKRLAKHVVGVGRSIGKLDTAIRRGAIDQATDDILVGAKDADLVIACVPIQSIVDSLEQASRVALPDAMLTVNRPTLVLWAMDDVALLPELVDGLQAWVPDLTLERIAGASHWVLHEQPARVIAGLTRFLGT